MDEKVKVIGVTGGIGTGKSTAAAFLKEKGLVHVDADEISKKLTADGSPMLHVLDQVFGPEGEMGKRGVDILRPDGSLDRKSLASIVFADKEKTRKLDELMFGAIIEEIDTQIESAKRDKRNGGILLDAPLLFEAGLDGRCDTVILLVADMDVRIQRVCRRDGITAGEVKARINNQMSDEEKIQRAHIVLDNSGTLDTLLDNLNEIYLTKFSKNSCIPRNEVL